MAGTQGAFLPAVEEPRGPVAAPQGGIRRAVRHPVLPEKHRCDLRPGIRLVSRLAHRLSSENVDAPRRQGARPESTVRECNAAFGAAAVFECRLFARLDTEGGTA